MTFTCDDCGGDVDAEHVRILVRETGPDLVLGLECRVQHATSKQFRPENPRDAVEELREGEG